jgi:hypothetical protein
MRRFCESDPSIKKVYRKITTVVIIRIITTNKIINHNMREQPPSTSAMIEVTTQVEAEVAKQHIVIID